MAVRLILSKALFDEAFFILSTGLAKEILQKWITCHIKAAICGDFSRCAGKPLARFYLRVQPRDQFLLHHLQKRRQLRNCPKFPDIFYRLQLAGPLSDGSKKAARKAHGFFA